MTNGWPGPCLRAYKTSATSVAIPGIRSTRSSAPCGEMRLDSLPDEFREQGTPPLRRRRFPVKHIFEVHMSGIDRFADLAAALDDAVAPTVFYRLDRMPFLLHGVSLAAPLVTSATPSIAAFAHAASDLDRPELPPSRVDTRLPQ